jgi:hypothetical protein
MGPTFVGYTFFLFGRLIYSAGKRQSILVDGDQQYNSEGLLTRALSGLKAGDSDYRGTENEQAL